MAAESYEYRGFELLKNYNGHWTIYPKGNNKSWTTAPNKADAERKIDKWYKEQGQ